MRCRRVSTGTPMPCGCAGRRQSWMGWTHFLTMTLPKVATGMALHVLAYNMKRVMAIVGVRKLMEVARA